MLFDGFATRNEVKRLNKAQLVRYYELLEAIDNVALEAGRAYLDVLRYRFLVDLAEDNYVQHRATFEQLLRRTQSGGGRRVDLEQAASRLALAEVNLTTETANLHDVTARYQRIINEAPPHVAFPPALIGRAMPASQKAALERMFKENPSVLAAQENIEAAEHDIAVRRAAYSPRLDFRARADNSENALNVIGDRINNVAEVVLTYNLFNGGSDRARERQYIERRNLAVDLRDKACRDTRQTLSIAYNDVQRLREQVSFLNIQVGLVEKTRDAYRDQFNVGQRTLLDLLDTENELLSARRGDQRRYRPDPGLCPHLRPHGGPQRRARSQAARPRSARSAGSVYRRRQRIVHCRTGQGDRHRSRGPQCAGAHPAREQPHRLRAVGPVRRDGSSRADPADGPGFSERPAGRGCQPGQGVGGPCREKGLCRLREVLRAGLHAGWGP